MAAFGFSAGDIITSINLIKDVIKALRSTRGASCEYVDLTFELYGLQDALREIQILHPQLEQGSLQASLAAAAQKCQATIDNFIEGLKKYQPCLGNSNGESHSWRGTLRKIQWQICKKDDIVNFRAEIGSHSHSIHMLLLNYQVQTAQLQRKTLEEQNADLKDNTEVLKQLEVAVHETKTEYGNLCRDVQNSMAVITNIERMGQTIMQVSASGYQTLHLLESLRNSIPAPVLLQNPIIFRDALDRVAPIHLDWIDSWEAFLAVLRLRFEDVGAQKIRRGEFILQDPAAGDIDFSRPWKVCFSPGQQIEMFVTSKRREKVGNATCPVCRQEHVGDSSVEIECERCHRTFRRVIDLEHEILHGNSKAERQVSRLDSPSRTQAPIPESSTIRGKCKRVYDSYLDDVEEPLGAFRRVRILCRKPPEPFTYSETLRNPIRLDEREELAIVVFPGPVRIIEIYQDDELRAINRAHITLQLL
ncbi:hypothetical protein PV08_10710 [Exophiala spinifera]|uniref:Ubiquitin-like domain-containing protein n=1 Tax=Exophiala spinifera TaxID=91928 RepID=A0A0D2AYD6_9EURO|nr:uncharacterized protein PV08_10710 [Exophiala spinifera]KIW11410.1 hypothetical protein PV08_10710 [Exophiala spinifera]